MLNLRRNPHEGQHHEKCQRTFGNRIESLRSWRLGESSFYFSDLTGAVLYLAVVHEQVPTVTKSNYVGADLEWVGPQNLLEQAVRAHLPGQPHQLFDHLGRFGGPILVLGEVAMILEPERKGQPNSLTFIDP